MLTRTGGDRAIFTSPRIVASLWEEGDRGELKQYAFEHLVKEMQTRYDQLGKDDSEKQFKKEIDIALARKAIKKKDFFYPAASYMSEDSDFPSPEAWLYYEPPNWVLDHYLNWIT